MLTSLRSEQAQFGFGQFSSRGLIVSLFLPIDLAEIEGEGEEGSEAITAPKIEFLRRP